MDRVNDLDAYEFTGAVVLDGGITQYPLAFTIILAEDADPAYLTDAAKAITRFIGERYTGADE